MELFRALDRNEKKRLIREAVCELKYLPCLNRDAKNCQKASNNRFGLLYHVERCGILLKVCQMLCFETNIVSARMSYHSAATYLSSLTLV